MIAGKLQVAGDQLDECKHGHVTLVSAFILPVILFKRSFKLQ